MSTFTQSYSSDRRPIPTYVISLPRDKERRERLRSQFPVSWPHFIIIDGVDAKDPSSLDLLGIYRPCPENDRNPLSVGEKCCAMSHLKALHRFLMTDADFCLILEDDVIGTEQDMSDAFEVIRCLPPDGVAVLGGQQGLINSRYLRGRKSGLKNVWKIPSISMAFLTRACSYAISRRTAELIIKKQQMCLNRADHWDRLLDKDSSVYYADIFAHPMSLSNSHLECDRQSNLGTFSRIKRDGVILIAQRWLKKIAIISLSRISDLQHVSIKNM